MSCPLYKDYTRMCVSEFEDVVRITNFSICASEKYQDCAFYRILHKIEPMCTYAEKCPIYFSLADGGFDALTTMTKNYCFSENYIDCERYKIRKTGKKPPMELYPDGSTFKF